MLTDRRRLMLSVFIAAAFGGADRGFAAGDQALFWRIKTRDNRSGIVFGFSEALVDHGVPGPQSFLEYNFDLLFSRISGSLTTSPGFFLAPVAH